MKINILYNFNEGAWGGGNQFLKALRIFFEQKGIYESDLTKADAILFNSHHCLETALNIKKNYPEKIFVHRVDGPIFCVRGQDRYLDRLIFMINNIIADGTIFQSKWSKQRCHELGMREGKYHEVILNAPDPNIFYAKAKKILEKRKIKLIATSWSSNIKKGFEIYQYLDENLNFSKYEMTFIGNSPMKFRNIRHVEPLPCGRLANEIRKHDIFITASLDDPCSNSLIEALHCGLPAVVRNSGGHPEIIANNGIVFDEKKDVCRAIDIVAHNYTEYTKYFNALNIIDIGNKYYNFIKRILDDINNKKYSPNKLSMLSSVRFILFLKFCYARLKIETALNSIKFLRIM